MNEQQKNAIRELRKSYPNVGQRTLAQAIVNYNKAVPEDSPTAPKNVIPVLDDRLIISKNELTALSFASIYGIIRRYDNCELAVGSALP